MIPIKMEITRCSRLTDAQLWAAVPRLVKLERDNLVGLLIHLGEINKRDLHLRHAYSGLFRYLLTLGFSEWESRARAIAATASQKYPSILGLLRSGRLSLSALAMIGPFLNAGNYRTLLRKACRRSVREIQALVAGLSPQAARRDVVRVVSAPSPLSCESAGAPQQAADIHSVLNVESLFPALTDDGGEIKNQVGERLLRFSFDGPQELDDMLERARALLWHKYPKGERGCIVLEALRALLEKIDPERRFERQLKRSRQRLKAPCVTQAGGLSQLIQP